MKALRCVLLAVATSGLLGCKSTFHINSYQPPANKIRSEEAVFIGVPPDAYDEPGSGRTCADALADAFEPYAARVQEANGPAPLDVYLKNAATQNFTYVLDCTIHSWEEEPTEWTGKPDLLDVSLRLLHTPDGAVVTETRFRGTSKWATFGGDHVEHLLKPLASEWVRAIYEGTDFTLPDSKNGTKQSKTERGVDGKK